MAAIVRRARAAPAATTAWTQLSAWRPRRPVGIVALAGWTRHLALLLRSGVPLATALETEALSRPTGWGDADVEALSRVRTAIREGSGFAESLGEHVPDFDAFAVRTLAASELTGQLEPCLERIADRYERRSELKRTVQRALMYPTIVALVAVGSVAALLIFVIPVFAETFAEFGEALPLPTRIVVALSSATIRYSPLLVAASIAMVGALVALYRSDRGRQQFDRWILSAPVVGPLAQASAVSDAMETLGGLVGGGIPLFEALPVAAATAGNRSIADLLEQARERIASGSTFADAIREGPTLPRLAVQMIAVGEQSGSLDDILLRVAAVFRNEAERRTSLLLSLLEPAIVLVLAGGVGGVVVAMYLPVFRLGAVIH